MSLRAVPVPRNPKAVKRSLRERAEIRRVWLELVQREPFERHTAKEIAKHLPFKLARNTVYWHMGRIRLDAALEALESLQCIK
jgi:hypothetical protein